jgi:hypothetical protein
MKRWRGDADADRRVHRRVRGSALVLALLGALLMLAIGVRVLRPRDRPAKMPAMR